MPKKLKILLVDEASYRRLLGRELKEAYGHEIVEAGGYEEAVQLFEQEPASFDLAIIDYSLEGQRNGVELLRRLHQSEPHLPVIIITGVGDRKISQEALRAGAFWYLDKPHDWVELEMLLKWVGRYRATSQPVNPQSVWGANLWMSVSDAIVSAKEIHALVEEVRTRALAPLEAENCGILGLDPETGKISDWYCEDETEKEVLDTLFSPLAHNMDSLEKPLVVTVEKDANELPFQFWAACACPPAKGSTEILFALFTNHLTEEQKLGLELKLVTLARLIGVALENLRKARLLEALADAGRDLLTVQARSDVYGILRDQILNKLGVRTFYLALHKRSSDTVHCPLFFHQGEDIQSRIPVLDLKKDRPENSFTVYVLSTNAELTILDSHDPSHPTRPYHIEGANTRSYFAVPLHRPDGSAFGVLSIQSAARRVFPEPLKQAVRTLASLAAPTLNRLRRNRLQEHLLDELRRGNPLAALQQSLTSIWESTNADLVVFYPYDSKRRHFRLDQTQCSPEYSPIPSALTDEIPTLNRLLDLGEYFAEDAASDEVFGRHWKERYGTESVGGVALWPTDTNYPVGIVLAHYRSRHDLNKKLQEHFKRFSLYTAVAAHLIEQHLRQQKEGLRREFIERLADISDRRKLAEEIESTLPQLWDALPICRFYLANRGERKLYSPLREEDVQSTFSEGLLGQVLGLTGPILLAEGTSTPALPPGVQSAIFAPVRLFDSLLGVISLASLESNLFEEEDRIFLEKVVKSAATILGAAGRTEYADFIMDAARKAAGDPTHGISIITESAHQLASQAGGAPTSTTLFLLNGKFLELVSAWPAALFDSLKSRVGRLPLEPSPGQRQGKVALAAKQGTQYVTNVKGDPHYIPYDDDTQAELAVPVLAADGGVIGVLNLEYRWPHNLTEDDRRLIETLASQAAVAAVIQRLAVESAEEHRKLAAEREKKKMMVILSMEAAQRRHQWQQAINSLHLDAKQGLAEAERLLNESPPASKDASKSLKFARQATGDMTKISVYLKRILKKLEEARPQEEGSTLEPNRLPLPVTAWLAALVEYYQAEIDTPKIKLFTETVPSDLLHVNEDWLSKAVLNLLDNAVRAATSLPDPWVALRSSRVDDKIVIKVQDSGPGVREELRPLLFHQIIPKDLRDRDSHGTGCFLTGAIVEMYDGWIGIEPHKKGNARGTTVVLKLPAGQRTADTAES